MIEVDGIEKHFGARRALGPVSLRIERGAIVGLLGLNGAGKTTCLRILAGELAPSAGAVRIDGAEPGDARAQVGWAPDVPPLDDDAPITELLTFLARLRGVPRDRVQAAVARAVARTGLAAEAGTPLGSLSHGLRKRAGVAQAIVHEPALVLLDEPGSGLDPAQLVAMRRLVRELAADHTVVVSSHQLAEIRATCSQIVLLHDGVVRARGGPRDLAGEDAPRRVELVVPAAARESAREALAGIAGARLVPGEEPGEEEQHEEPGEEDQGPAAHEVTLTIESPRDVRAEATRALVAIGVDVLGVRAADDDLERVFLDLARGSGGNPR